MIAPRLVHVGSAVVDYVYRIDALPPAGTERTAAAYAQVVGGGFNMMVAARRTGLKVAFAGQHGTGPNGNFLRAALAAESIEVLAPQSVSMDTGNCVVLVTADAERTFVSWPGAEGMLTPASFERIRLQPGDWVFTSGYTLSYPGSRDALANWIEALPPQVPFVFDPTPVVAEIPADILARVLARTTWLSCNTQEAACIVGLGSVEAMSERLLGGRCTQAAGVVVRSGPDGCFVRLANGDTRSIAGFKVRALDTNGAGDTHIGSFVSELTRGAHPFEAARYANAAAAISVTRHGGSSAPTNQEIRAFLSRFAERATANGINVKASA